jgi:hypothetical protein
LFATACFKSFCHFFLILCYEKIEICFICYPDGGVCPSQPMEL